MEGRVLCGGKGVVRRGGLDAPCAELQEHGLDPARSGKGATEPTDGAAARHIRNVLHWRRHALAEERLQRRDPLCVPRGLLDRGELRLNRRNLLRGRQLRAPSPVWIENFRLAAPLKRLQAQAREEVKRSGVVTL